MLGALAFLAALACVVTGAAKPGPLYAAASVILTIVACVVAARPGPRPVAGLLVTAAVLGALIVLHRVTDPRDVAVMFALPALGIAVALIASGRAHEVRLPDPDLLAARAIEYRRRHKSAPARPPAAAESDDFPGLW